MNLQETRIGQAIARRFETESDAFDTAHAFGTGMAMFTGARAVYHAVNGEMEQAKDLALNSALFAGTTLISRQLEKHLP